MSTCHPYTGELLEEDERGGKRFGCRTVLPPHGMWDKRIQDAALAERCKWHCVGSYRRVQMASGREHCIPCVNPNLPHAAEWFADDDGSSCTWRCKVGFQPLEGAGCTPCTLGLPQHAEWRDEGHCAWRCKTGYAGGDPHAHGLERVGCKKCIQSCDAGAFMVGEGGCPPGTPHDPRRCEKCPRALPAFTTWTRGCKFRCGNGFYRSPLGCASCTRTCQPGQVLSGVCDPYAMQGKAVQVDIKLTLG